MGHDNQCCYNSDGNLIETNTKTFGGTANRYHYKGGADDNIPYLSNIYDDVVPYMYCCQYPAHYNLDVDTCQRFLRRRPPSRCSGYIPPRSGMIIFISNQIFKISTYLIIQKSLSMGFVLIVQNRKISHI